MYELKKILHLHLKWHILRSYHFVAGLTLIVKNKTSFLSLRNQLMRTNGWMRTGWDWMKTNEWLNPFWKMCQNVKKSSLLSKIVKDNVTVYKRIKLSKKTGLFSVKFNTKLTYLKFHNCFGLPHLKKHFQDNFSENLQKFCSVTYCAKIKKGDNFAKVIICLLSSLPQTNWLKYLLKE